MQCLDIGFQFCHMMIHLADSVLTVKVFFILTSVCRTVVTFYVVWEKMEWENRYDSTLIWYAQLIMDRSYLLIINKEVNIWVFIH